MVNSSTYSARSYAVPGLTVCNNLPDYLRNPALSDDILKRNLKIFPVCSVVSTNSDANNPLETQYLCAVQIHC